MSNNQVSFFNKYEPDSMLPNIRLFWKSAKGIHIWDRNDKKYIDFTSSIFVTNIGHGNKNFANKIEKILKSPISHTYIYFNNPRKEYIKKLINFIDNKKLKKCFLVSSGTESIEAAVKLMRLNGMEQHKNKKGIISLKGNWHGRTMGAQMLSDNISQSKWISPDKDVFHIDFPYPWIDEFDSEEFFQKSIDKVFNKKFNFKNKITGLVIEAFQGWGALFYPKNYVKSLNKFCKKNKILITIDEMQSGFCRTGKKFAYEHYNFSPDLMCIGKAMGSGLPLSGVVTSNKIINVKDGSLTSTHSANPISCVAGIATIDEIKRLNLVKKLKKTGKIFENLLEELHTNHKNIINCVSGKGMIGAIIFKDFKKIKSKHIADKVSFACLKKGLLVVNTGRESIKLGPPLIISETELKKSFKIINESITEVELI